MIFILDRQEKVIGILKNGGANSGTAPYFDDILTQDLATGAETYQFSTVIDDKNSSLLQVGNFIAFKENDKYKLFQILQTVEDHQESLFMTVYCECAGLELINKVIRKQKLVSASVKKFMETVLQDTGWNVGGTPYDSDSLDIEIDNSSVYATIQNNISKYNVEIEFRVELNNGKISRKFVDVYNSRGRVTGKRFEFGKNIAGISRKTDSTNLYTALIGRGNNNISFKDITIDGIDKPLGQDFVADAEAYDRYNHNGYHIMGLFEFDTDSPEELLRETYKALKDCKEPKIEYEINVEMLDNNLNQGISSLGIGDTVIVVDNFFNPPIHLAARVSKLETSKTNPDNNVCTLANFVEVKSNITDEMRKIASQLEGYVEGTINNKFPIKSEDISEGAVNGSHIYRDSITTEHLQADSIKSNHIDANQILAKHIQANEITADHIQSGSITANELEAAIIKADSALIQDGALGTAQIADAAITNAKIGKLAVGEANIQNASITNAKIKDLNADKITAGSIDAERLTANIIEAINMSVSGKIDAEHIDVNSLVVDNLDASKITTGTLDADRITSSVISAINASIENATINQAKIGELSANKITSGEISTKILSSNIIKAINASIGKISADHIDVDSIEVKNINAENITSGNIDTDRLQANVIAAINSYAGTMKIQQGQIETLRVGNANITDLDASKIKTGKIKAERIDVDSITIKDANIQSLNASKINGGTLDCNNMKVTNLKADSIVAGSLVVQGENLIPNSTFQKGREFWNLHNTQFVIDDTQEYEGVKVVKYERESEEISNYYAIGCHNINGNNTGYLATKGNIFVASVYIKIPEENNIPLTNGKYSWIPCLGIWYYGVNSDGTLFTKYSNVVSADMNKIGEWQRLIISLEAPEGTVYVKPVICARGKGIFYFSKPMLSRGQIASEWKPHADELISDGAITEDKISNNAITTNKLNLEELFVSDGAFINNIKATEIDASKITTGKISSERLDITGLVGFESFNDEVNTLFDTSGNKTYINGGMIATNTVTADKIDIKGLTVCGKDNTPTFAVSKEGEVVIDAILKSENYDINKGTGYQVTTDGKAIFNEAEIRGDVKLPNAGITNYGGTAGNPNLLRCTDFDYEILDNMKYYWQHADNSNTYMTKNTYGNWGMNKEYDSDLKGKSILTSVLQCSATTNQTYLNPCGVINGVRKEYIELKPNTTYTLSARIYLSGNTQSYHFYLWGYDDDGSNRTSIASSKQVSGYTGAFENFKFTFTTDKRKYYQLRFYHNKKTTVTTGKSELHFSELKLEEGSEATQYKASIEDSINYVRFWAGSDYDNRDNAPFRVLQNGDLIANRGTFGGTVASDEVNVGKIHLHQDSIVINSTLTKMLDDGQVVSYEGRCSGNNPHIELKEGQSLINTNLILGSEDNTKIFYDNNNKILESFSTNLNLNGGNTTLKFDSASAWGKGGIYLENEFSKTGNSINLAYSSTSSWLDTFIVTSKGGKGDSTRGDINIRRENFAEDIDVQVEGNIIVRNALKGKSNKMEMRTSSSGFSFYAI